MGSRMMLSEKSRRPRLYLVASDEAPAARPTFPDLGIVLAVCIPFWAGVAWLVSAWL